MNIHSDAAWREMMLAVDRNTGEMTTPSSTDWLNYIHSEVRATCSELSWGYQVRRKWEARETPVPESLVDDYEWKLIPRSKGQLPDQSATDFDEGTYFVVSLNRQRSCFVLQHSTHHAGELGPQFSLRTFTEIAALSIPVDGYLRWYLLALTARFEPNHFSVT